MQVLKGLVRAYISFDIYKAIRKVLFDVHMSYKGITLRTFDL